MGRSSRHESSHRVQGRSSRDGRDRSDSEEEETPRERKSREASMPADSGKRKSSSSGSRSHGKTVSGAVNGDCNRTHSAKKRERHGGSVSPDDERYSVDEMELKVDDLLEDAKKAKVSIADSKIRASKRREGSSDGKNESSRRKSDKDYNRKESSSHHKDGKDRDEGVRERDSGRSRDSKSDKEKEKKTQVSRRERSRDASSRKRGGATNSGEDESSSKKNLQNDDWQTEDEPHITESKRDSDKVIKQLDDYRESKDGESQRSRSKSGTHKEEKHREGISHRDKYRDEGGHKDHRREEKSKDDSSRDRSGRSHSKHYRDDRKSDKSRHHDSDYDGSPYRDSSRGRKRHSDEGDGILDSKSRSSKEPRVNLERSASNKAFLDAPESHPRTSPSRPGDGSSLSEERQASRSIKEKQVKDSTPLTERTPLSASELPIGSSPFTRIDNFSPAAQALNSMEEDGPFKGGARYKRAADLGLNRAAPWKGVNPWPTPTVNGFIPFQHIPPPHGFLNQFPPSLFGVRPGVPFHHLHEPPRPYLWPNPNDAWDEDAHMYGRLPAAWEMKTQTQTQIQIQSQNVDLVQVKEPEPMPDIKQARSPAESIETKESQETTIPVAPSKTEEKVNFCNVYLSRLDISPYLASSELHKQCVDLAGVADVAKPIPRFRKSRTEEVGSDVSLTPRFPVLPETVFERAMSLYDKQTEAWKTRVGHPTREDEKIKPFKSPAKILVPKEEEEEEKQSNGSIAMDECEKGLMEASSLIVSRIHGSSQSTH